jgi:dTDP-glucose 4,6-dehydratase
MNILVTGGAGFIGSNFLQYMVENYPHYQLTCLDKLTYAGNLNNIAELISSEKVYFIKGDIADRNFITELFNQNSYDIVVNFAAESHVDRSISNPREFLETNYMGVFNLLEEVRMNSKIRFHQVSTDEVYGDLPLNRPDLLFNEESRFNPSSPYSASKAAADLLVKAYHRTYGIHATISHSTNNYGPYQFPEKLIPLVIQRAKDDLTIPVYGNGLNVRDWVHVLDHCSAIDLIVHKGKSGETYNIGGACEQTNISVVENILDSMGKSKELIKYVRDRAGHDLRYAVDISKITNNLGWRPHISFIHGLRETIKWYESNSTLNKTIIIEKRNEGSHGSNEQ